MTDFVQQRINMVESQVRPSDVTDRRIIAAMLELPREAFVPEAMRSMAYMDEAVRVTPGNGSGAQQRHLLPPRTLAKLIQAAGVEPSSVVLDVGPATGYSTALLAKLAARVVGVEVDEPLLEAAASTLKALGISNVRLVSGPLEAGAPGEGPFDVILLNGAVEEVAPALIGQLKDGGRLAGVQSSGPFGRAQVWLRTGSSYAARPAFDAAVPPIPGFARPQGFVF